MLGKTCKSLTHASTPSSKTAFDTKGRPIFVGPRREKRTSGRSRPPRTRRITSGGQQGMERPIVPRSVLPSSATWAVANTVREGSMNWTDRVHG